MDLKIHTSYKFTEGSWGGGNQFLKSLREYFKKVNVYSEKPENADVILFNSHHCLDEVFTIKRKYPDKILIHRVDGPVLLVRGNDRTTDKIVFQFNNLLADGTVFQSKWSREKNHEVGFKKSRYETIIMNAPNPAIFNPEGRKPFNKNKIKLIATSWSENPRKGFDIYKYLDENLDFKRYEMTFVGNSPIEFKNIRWLKPVLSQELSEILKDHDIYITGSKNDPCSNSLIEAIHCSLPAITINSGGHPEIIGGASELFNNEKDLLDAIDKVVDNYEQYRSQIKLPTIDEIGRNYYRFAEMIHNDFLSGKYYPKRINLLDRVIFKLCINLKVFKKLLGLTI